MFKSPIPTRIRVLVIGGGLHGLGVLHDLATRGWNDIHLVEKTTVSRQGTCSQSMLHARWIVFESINDISATFLSMRETKVLESLLDELIVSARACIPLVKETFGDRLVFQMGLAVRRLLAIGSGGVGLFHLDLPGKKGTIPLLKNDKIDSVYHGNDYFIDSEQLTCKLATMATKLGIGITEGCTVLGIRSIEDGWLVDLELEDGSMRTISALHVINATGSDCNRLLIDNGLNPILEGFLLKRLHVLLKAPDNGMTVGYFIPDLKRGRHISLIPVAGGIELSAIIRVVHENEMYKSVDHEPDLDWIFKRVELVLHLDCKSLQVSLPGIDYQWFSMENSANTKSGFNNLSVSEHLSGRGTLVTVYGGRLANYRLLAQEIGDRLVSHFGEFTPSFTDSKYFWTLA